MTPLNRLVSNVVAPESSKRRLLMAAVQSVLLYRAEVSAHSLEAFVPGIEERDADGAYRTVSEAAV